MRFLAAALTALLLTRASHAQTNTVFAEAEEFQITSPGWQPKKAGTNYYNGTFANTFLSRKAYLGAPGQCDRTEARKEITIPAAGTYLALVRYEQVHRFETRFHLRIEQGGKVKRDREYGAPNNLKIWPFKEGLKASVEWSWGATENIVWEGHDAAVDLDAGPATLILIADRQPGQYAARRNVDLVMLTSDRPQVEQRIAKENYLPLDGMLTQAGDLFVRVHNSAGAADVTLNIPSGTEHSPYWVHQRNWKPKELSAKAGESTDWVEVGSLLDSLSDGQWKIELKDRVPRANAPKFALEFGVPAPGGKIESIRRFDDLTGKVELAYDADTRTTRRIRLSEEVLYELVGALKKLPVAGTPPRRTLIYGYTFSPRPENAKFIAALAEFQKLMGGTAIAAERVENLMPTPDGLIRGYIDVRGEPTAKLEAYCQTLQAEGKANDIAVVSLGDEIDLPKPPAKSDDAFRAWLESRNLKPADVDPTAADDWTKITYSPSDATAKTKPGLYYWSKIWSYRYGIATMKDRTDILRKHLPNAGVGANFSPHGPGYLGDVHHWISVFREGGMTQPWGEDYIFQMPMGTQQMNFIVLDMFRAGIANHEGAKIHYYVMPHAPGNTPASWRRQFYGAIAHGAKVLNLFEFRPVQAAYTENHVNSIDMYQAVRTGIHELGRFEEIVQAGHVRPAEVGLWFSEAADVWHDNRAPFAAGKRTLYIALRHQQLPLDMVVEGDDLSKYKLIYLTDRHVSSAGTKALTTWVENGGVLAATAGAGMRDEMDRPNEAMATLLGIREESLDISPDRINREKEDLPWAIPMGTVPRPRGSGEALEILGARTHVKANGAELTHHFTDGQPAIAVRKVGKGQTCSYAFLPGLSYFRPAIPKRPLDRGTTDDSFAHFIPTQFSPLASEILRLPALSASVSRPVECSSSLVETTVIQSDRGLAIPLINWSGAPFKGLSVRLSFAVEGRDVSLASGGAVKEELQAGRRTFLIDLDVADALIFR